jgi:hypothetical protein
MKMPAVLVVMFAMTIMVQAQYSPAGAEADTGSSAFFEYLLKKREINSAGLEYERLLFSGVADTFTLTCSLGAALLGNKEAEKAEALYERAVDIANDPEQKAKAESGLIRAYLMRRKPALAQSELNGLDSAVRTVLGSDAAAWLSILTYATAYQVDSARQALLSMTGNSRYDAKARDLDSLLTWYRSQGMKNPLNAFIYSSAVPGWGYWYIGDRKKAAASFALMAGVSAFMCYEGYRFYRGDTQERYIRGMDLFLIWGVVWRRYYHGIRKASHHRVVEINGNVQIEYQRRLSGIIAGE